MLLHDAEYDAPPRLTPSAGSRSSTSRKPARARSSAPNGGPDQSTRRPELRAELQLSRSGHVTALDTEENAYIH